MAAEAARILEFPDDYIYGSAAPGNPAYENPAAGPADIPATKERIRERERAEAEIIAQNVPSVSLFAIFGSVLVGIMLVFCVLAQINYNEIAGETARLNAQFGELTEKQRRLEITFESVIDMKEVERYARDELGMSKPEADQIAVVHPVPGDKAEIVSDAGENWLQGLGAFISQLAGYFVRTTVRG